MCVGGLHSALSLQTLAWDVLPATSHSALGNSSTAHIGSDVKLREDGSLARERFQRPSAGEIKNAEAFHSLLSSGASHKYSKRPL